MGANDEHKAIIDGSQGNIRNAIDREVSAELQAEWEGILSRLRAEVGETAFQSWLRPMRVHCVDADVVQISVPTRFMRDWAAAHYEDRLTELWRGENAAIAGVEIVVYADVADSKSAAVVKAEADVQSVATIVRGRDTLSAPLDERFTFDQFVVGKSNEFAYAAARRIGEASTVPFNPLFLYGGVGLGKTHLMHAIAWHVREATPERSVLYLSAEKFMYRFIRALREQNTVDFKEQFRSVDVLMIDDVQFIAGKDSTQEEFFHTFNALHEAHKQIVLTCDRPASEIQNLEHRLVSRFEWGLVTDLQPPDVETRLAILRNKVKTMGVEIPEDVLTFLANRIRTNIRRLEGALIRVASYAHLTGKELTNDVVENLLREILQEEGRHTITIEVIQKKVAEKFDLRMADMTSKRRPENIAFPRQIAMFLSRQLTEHSLSAIGEAFGGRDHGTVLHACRLVKDRMEIDANVRQTVHYLEKQLLR